MEERVNRVFTSYAVINFHAADEKEASRMLYTAEDVLNAIPGVDAVLDDECYELKAKEMDEQWLPERPEGDDAH